MNDNGTLSIERVWTEGADVLTLRGDLDLTSVGSLISALDATEATKVILELNAVTFIDSAGMRAVDQARRQLAGGRRLLIVAGSDSPAAWAFRVAGYEENLIVPSLDEAIQS
ncbi:MAG TPA: STAS domain-containing protein [Acidimicrobiia bacterium]|nr:STAS domain-containing protein [Acidimicrobiia bacterium]